MALEDIAHIVVLMLENRSFDCMLGKLYPKSAEFDGLSGTEANEDLDGTPVAVWNSGDTSQASINDGPARIEALPYAPSPAEVATARTAPLNKHQRSLLQLAAHLPATTAVGGFNSFIESYLDHLRAGGAGTDVSSIHDVSSAVALIKSRLGNLFRSL
jgi:hypothetical protein